MAKNISVFILILACALSLTACAGESVFAAGRVQDVEGDGETARIELSDGAVELEISRDSGEKLTEDRLVTNTKRITVTAAGIERDAEVYLYLYNVEYEEPIGYAFLGAKDRSAQFNNLTSACEYRIGAVVENCDGAVILNISDSRPILLDILDK